MPAGQNEGTYQMLWVTSVALLPGTPGLDTTTLREGLPARRLQTAGCLYLWVMETANENFALQGSELSDLLQVIIWRLGSLYKYNFL